MGSLLALCSERSSGPELTTCRTPCAWLWRAVHELSGAGTLLHPGWSACVGTDGECYLVIQWDPSSHLHSVLLWVIVVRIIEFPSQL